MPFFRPLYMYCFSELFKGQKQRNRLITLAILPFPSLLNYFTFFQPG